MRPDTQTSQNTGFQPKWRHFHPMDRIWIRNPFDHDVLYQVADEFNRPFKYRLPANKVSELPGGAIATLGVKAIVDELIQNTPKEEALMWDPPTRKRHEDQVIMREKHATMDAQMERPGEVNLGVTVGETEQTTEVPVTQHVETAFPSMNHQPTVMTEPRLAPLPPSVAGGIGDIIAASLPKHDAVVNPNNAHPDAED